MAQTHGHAQSIAQINGIGDIAVRDEQHQGNSPGQDIKSQGTGQQHGQRPDPGCQLRPGSAAGTVPQHGCQDRQGKDAREKAPFQKKPNAFHGPVDQIEKRIGQGIEFQATGGTKFRPGRQGCPADQRPETLGRKRDVLADHHGCSGEQDQPMAGTGWKGGGRPVGQPGHHRVQTGAPGAQDGDVGDGCGLKE